MKLLLTSCTILGTLSFMLGQPRAAEPNPDQGDHGLVQATVKKGQTTNWKSYQYVKREWDFLRADTHGEDKYTLCREMELEYNTVLDHDPNLPWVRFANAEKEEGKENYVIWMTQKEGEQGKNAAAGYRSYAIIRGRYYPPGQAAPGPGPGGNQGKKQLPPEWFTNIIDLDIDADTNRDGPENLGPKNDAEKEVAEDGDEDNPKDNPIGAIVLGGSKTDIVLRGIQPKGVEQGKVTIVQAKAQDKDGKDIEPQGEVKVTRANGTVVTPDTDLWTDLCWNDTDNKPAADLWLKLEGVKPGVLLVTVHYERGTLKFDDRVRVTVDMLDIDGDSDHDGEVTHSAKEDELEDKDGEDGVLVLPNWDDDDKPGEQGHGDPDCLVENTFAVAAYPREREKRYDNRINGDQDRQDMGELHIGQLGALPKGWKVQLRLSEEDAERVRIFNERDEVVILPKNALANAEPAIKDRKKKAGDPHNVHTVENVVGKSGQYHKYLVEGIRPGERIKATLVVLNDKQEVQNGSTDAVRVRVAPMILIPDARNVEWAMATDLRKAPPITLPHPYWNIPGGAGALHNNDLPQKYADLLGKAFVSGVPISLFMQDNFQEGYAQVPAKGGVKTMRLLMRIPAENEGVYARFGARSVVWLWPNRDATINMGAGPVAFPRILKDGSGIFELFSPRQDVDVPEFGGNIEATWALQGKKFGQVMIGSKCPDSSMVAKFFQQQGVQMDRLSYDTSWLLVGHVDEVCHFLKQDQVAVMDTVGALALADAFSQAQVKASPWKVLFAKSEVDHGALAADAAFDPATGTVTFTLPAALVAKLKQWDYIHFYDGQTKHHTFRVEAAKDDKAVTCWVPSAWASRIPDPKALPKKGDNCVVGRQAYIFKSRATRLYPYRFVVGMTTALGWEEARTNAAGASPEMKNLRDLNKKIGEQKNGALEKALSALKPAPQLLRLPVLMWNLDRDSAVVECMAFTPNLVNGVFLTQHNARYVLPEPFVGDEGKGDIFAAKANQALQGYRTEYVDQLFYLHYHEGEIHCGTVCTREPWGAEQPWWK